MPKMLAAYLLVMIFAPVSQFFFLDCKIFENLLLKLYSICKVVAAKYRKILKYLRKKFCKLWTWTDKKMNVGTDITFEESPGQL